MKRKTENTNEVNMKKEKLYELMFGCVGTLCVPLNEHKGYDMPTVTNVEKIVGTRKARVKVKDNELVVCMN